jgi:hypothetical protein
VVVTVTLVVFDPRVLVTTNEPLPTDETVPNAAFPKPKPPPPRGDPLGRVEGRKDARALGLPPKPPAREQLPVVDVIMTLVAVSAVTGARLDPVLGRALGLAFAGVALAVTQSPTFSAAAVVVTDWLNVVDDEKVTVVWVSACVFWTKMLVGLTALIVPDVPGRAEGAAFGPAPRDAAGVVPAEAEPLPPPPQAAASTITPSATAGTCNWRARSTRRVCRRSDVGTFTVDSLSMRR